ncbi:hypothetical protein PR048_005441 [Dryococelus australis]|uniref:Uncharacterized protein n=1 Tax=Dryococelus australis TaxID=614101 RepID=A0ABQ9I860_9NEOP|nr:hypothetical protein PR048_005441 [Dryococelus australis]
MRVPVFPQPYLLFWEKVTVNKAKDLEKRKRKCISITHSIITAVPPQSFMSPILISRGLLLYRKYGSKNLINILSSLGFYSSYYEVQLLEMSTILHTHPNMNGSFSQFMLDNADFNVCTIDGLNFLHAMGGIRYITPKCSDLGVLEQEMAQPKPYDILLMSANLLSIPEVAKLKAFLYFITKYMYSEKTKVVPLPFINSPASDYDTIYTAFNQKSQIVRFDQPLYIKGKEKIAADPPDSPLSKCVVRLGGFHLLMSFLGIEA